MDISPYEDKPGSSAATSTGKQPFPMKMVGYLSNYEVYNFLKDVKDKSHQFDEKKKKFAGPGGGQNKHLSTVVYEALHYLKQTPCVSQTPERIRDFMHKIQPFMLTKTEQLMLLNTKPLQAVDIQALIEEAEDRLTEEQVDEVLRIVQDCFGVDEDQSDATMSVKQEPMDD